MYLKYDGIDADHIATPAMYVWKCLMGFLFYWSREHICVILERAFVAFVTQMGR